MGTTLTRTERQILTCAFDLSVGHESSMAHALGLPPATVMRALQKLLAEGLLYTMDLETGTFIYLHTKKVTREMLDEETHYRFGGRPRHTYPIGDPQP